MTHAELVERGAKWLKNNDHYRYRSNVVLTEFVSYASEIPDVIGFSNSHTNVIECKVSLADFKSDSNKIHRHLHSCGNWRMYLCPADLIPVDDIPEGWGLLYAYEKQIKIIKAPPDHYEPHVRAEEYKILYSIVRRLESHKLMSQIRAPLRSKGE